MQIFDVVPVELVELGAQAACKLCEHEVTDFVPKLIVDVSELIDIDQAQHEGQTGRIGARLLVLDASCEVGPAQSLRQRVSQRMRFVGARALKLCHGIVARLSNRCA